MVNYEADKIDIERNCILDESFLNQVCGFDAQTICCTDDMCNAPFDEDIESPSDSGNGTNTTDPITVPTTETPSTGDDTTTSDVTGKNRKHFFCKHGL